MLKDEPKQKCQSEVRKDTCIFKLRCFDILLYLCLVCGKKIVRIGREQSFLVFYRIIYSNTLGKLLSGSTFCGWVAGFSDIFLPVSIYYKINSYFLERPLVLHKFIALWTVKNGVFYRITEKLKLPNIFQMHVRPVPKSMFFLPFKELDTRRWIFQLTYQDDVLNLPQRKQFCSTATAAPEANDFWHPKHFCLSWDWSRSWL